MQVYKMSLTSDDFTSCKGNPAAATTTAKQNKNNKLLLLENH